MDVIPTSDAPADHDWMSTRVDTASTGVDGGKHLSLLPCTLACLPGLLLMLILFGHRASSTVAVDDFTGFLVGAKLLWTSQLYEVQANTSLQKEIVGQADSRTIFVRLPFFAYVMKPFLSMPYRTAIYLWRGLMLLALIIVAAISARPRRYLALALCWSIPAAAAVALGNDSPLILLFLSISLACWSMKWRIMSGAALGLCLAKFHFLIFLPLLLLRRVYRRELMGFSGVAALLAAVNFAVQPDWVRLYWRALNLPQPNMNSKATLMPNFYSSFFWTGHPGVAVVLGAFLIGVLLWPICKRLPFNISMPLCIFGGLLAAPHTNYLDAILFMPGIIAVVRAFAGFRLSACFLLSPVAGSLCVFGPPTIGPVVVVGVSLWVLWKVHRVSHALPS